MNINKYIELLRFYISEKLDEIKESLNKTLEAELKDIFNSIIASILAIFISNGFTDEKGIIGTISKIACAIIVYFIVYKILKLCYRKSKIKSEIRQSENNDSNSIEAKVLIEKFDHIACDSIILAWDFINKSSKSKTASINEKEFYIIESFYYYKKAVDIVSLVLDNSQSCINSSTVKNGIAKYRIENVYNRLEELDDRISQSIITLSFNKDDLLHEKKETDEKLEKIKNRLPK